MTQSTTASQPGRRGIYYGWKVLVALFLAGFMVYGGGLYSFVLFVPPLTEEFHWSRAATSGLVTAFWLSAPLILVGGMAIKRVGAMRLLLTGIVLEAVCVALLATVSTFGQMYLLRAVMGFGKVMFAVTLPYAVSRWFSRRYSFALGVAWSGWHIGGLVLAPLTGLIIARHGWRTACLAIAIGLLTVALVPVLLTGRHRSPADLGVAMDGDESAPAGGEAAAATDPAAGPVGSVRDLLRTPMFWLIALVTFLFYLTYGGLLTHEAAVEVGAGFSPGLSSVVLGSAAGFAAVGASASAGCWTASRSVPSAWRCTCCCWRDRCRCCGWRGTIRRSRWSPTPPASASRSVAATCTSSRSCAVTSRRSASRTATAPGISSRS